jgi:hypothetical protein
MTEQIVKPIGFGERPGSEPYNASEIVTLADSRFLFCDNNIGDALFELRLTPDAQMACSLIRRQIEGIAPGTVDDLEGMAMVEMGDRRFIFALPSLSLKKRNRLRKKKSKRGKVFPPRNGFIRISEADGDRLAAEVCPDFRDWLVEHAPELGKSPRYLPDDGGLNVEGVGWDPKEQALLLGVRTPVVNNRPLILRLHVKEIDGPWDLSNFEMLPAIQLGIEDPRGEQGIRTIEYDPSRKACLLVVGNSTSSSTAPFRLYSWDGNSRGEVSRLASIKFHRKMRVEGVARGTIYGRGAIVFVDDRGGYQVLWDDPPIN